MSWLRQFLFKFMALFRRRQLEREMAEEMALHLEDRVRRNVAAGMEPEQARFAAQKEFGGVEQLKEYVREAGRWIWLEHAMQDLRYGMRSLRKMPGFTAVVVVTMALGIGVTTSSYSLIRDYFLRPLLRDYQLNLVEIHNGASGPERDFRGFSFAELEVLRGASDLFSDIAAITFSLGVLERGDHIKRALICLVSDNYFSLLRVRPQTGRFFSAAECQLNANARVAVAEYGLWNRLGRPADFVGSLIRINGADFTIVGIAPEGFGGLHGSITPEVWVPLGVASQLGTFGSGNQDLMDARSYRLFPIGSMVGAITLEGGRQRLSSLDSKINSLPRPSSMARKLFISRPSRLNIATTQPEDPSLHGFVGRLALLATALALAVLLIACFNTANLLLARGTVRQREFAIRIALGASRSRVIRQLLVEGTLLGLLGGTLGMFLTWCSSALLSRWSIEVFSAGKFAFHAQPPIDGSILVVALVVSLIASVAFSLFPAFRATKIDLTSDLKQQGSHGVAAGAWTRFFSPGNCLAIGQVSLSMVLLFTAGLFVRAGIETKRLDHGFETTDQWVANFDYGFGKSPRDQVWQRQQALLTRVRELPGVAAAAISTAVPYNFDREMRRAFAVGQATNSGWAAYTVVSRDYFHTVGIRLLRGRDFNESEVSQEPTPPVAIIDDSLGRALFGEDDPIGRHFVMNRNDADGQHRQREIEVIGIVRSARDDVFEATAPLRIYRPFGQMEPTNIYVHIRFTAGVPAPAMLDRVRHELRTIEPDNPLLLLQPFTDFLDKNINFAGVRLAGTLTSVCGVIALALALVGVYGLKAYSVARRTREIGIRLALGATPAAVRGLILTQGGMQSAVAIALGVGLALLLTPILGSLLYRISAVDWFLLTTTGAAIFGATLCACFVPAWRATKVDPMIALRCE